jgi:mRNA interferase HicA
MKCSKFKRWLEQQGCQFYRGKGSHSLCVYKGRTTVFADHGAKEMPTGTMMKILRDLGLKEEFKRDH